MSLFEQTHIRKVLTLDDLPPTIMAISLWQPWASFMAHGLKRNETRSWYTPYRGPLAIAATKSQPKDEMDEVWEAEEGSEVHDQYKAGLLQMSPNTDPRKCFDGLPRGCVVCVVNLIDCVRTEEFVPHGNREARRTLSYQEWCYGDYSLGRYAWITEMIHRFEEPVPCRGAQQLWDWERPR